MLYKGDPTPIDIEKARLRFSNRLAGGVYKNSNRNSAEGVWLIL